MPNNVFGSPPAAQTGAQGVVPDDHSSNVGLAIPAVANTGAPRDLRAVLAAVHMVPLPPATPVGNNVIPPGSHVRAVSLAAAAVRTPGVEGSQQEMTNAVAN